MWGWFLELHARRGNNGFSANTLAWTDILAWVYLTRPIIRSDELKAILALDNCWMAIQAEHALKEEQNRKNKARR